MSEVIIGQVGRNVYTSLEIDIKEHLIVAAAPASVHIFGLLVSSHRKESLLHCYEIQVLSIILLDTLVQQCQDHEATPPRIFAFEVEAHDLRSLKIQAIAPQPC